MSNDVNTRIEEGLMERLANIEERITPDAFAEMQRLLSQGDLETAIAFMETLEALYADDL